MTTPLLLDMVHHNPGEAPFDSRFLDPRTLDALGFNGQVFKHLNCAVRFDTLGRDDFAPGTPAGAWMDAARARIHAEIAAAKTAGLQVFYHIDLFVLPAALVAAERDALCDETGRISIERPRTLEVHRALFTEIFRDFPEVDGLIVRTGETYLMDTPHHTGNGPVQFHGGSTLTLDREQTRFITLLTFLRAEICERHGRWLLHRTWDTCPDRFHANAGYYLAVVGHVAPHPKLVFSIKHTALDFFRRTPVNPCLGLGPHPQIVEVQCQREYEGKGAHPNYIARGVIEGFEETPGERGLRAFAAAHPAHYRGLYTWTRGGGWYGPYLKNEFWCELNARVLIAWGRAPARPEDEIFDEVALTLGFRAPHLPALRRLCLLSATAVLRGRYCATRVLNLCWMRDQNIGGLDQLRDDLPALEAAGQLDAAVAEKLSGLPLWAEMETLAADLACDHPGTADYVRASTRYGHQLYAIVAHGWRALAEVWRAENGFPWNRANLAAALADYDSSWARYERLPQQHPELASLYRREFWNWPGQPGTPGLDAAMKRGRHLLVQSTDLVATST